MKVTNASDQWSIKVTNANGRMYKNFYLKIHSPLEGQVQFEGVHASEVDRENVQHLGYELLCERRRRRIITVGEIRSLSIRTLGRIQGKSHQIEVQCRRLPL